MSTKPIPPALRRLRRTKPGAEVRILRQDIYQFRHWGRKHRPHGRIVRIDGGNVFVRPHTRWWRANWPSLHLYTNEIELVNP